MVDKNKFVEEEAEGYAIHVMGRSVQVTEAMKNYAWDKLSKMDRLHPQIMHVHITMDIHRLEHNVEIMAKFRHFFIRVHATSSDMYASVDKAVDRLVAQLRRWKGKIQDYHRKKLSEIDMQVNVFKRPYDEIEDFNADIEAAVAKEEVIVPEIIGTETQLLKVLTPAEALMKLDLAAESFLLFRDEMDGKLKVIYRRPDGNYGIMQPE